MPCPVLLYTWVLTICGLVLDPFRLTAEACKTRPSFPLNATRQFVITGETSTD